MSDRSRAGLQGDVIRVLVCDDSTEIRAATNAALAGRPDYEVIGQAADAAGSISEIVRTRPDVVILDLNMPGSGAAVIRQVSSMPDPPQIVIYSAATALGSRRTSMAAGAGEYVVKTGRLRPLLAAVDRAARRVRPAAPVDRTREWADPRAATRRAAS